MRERESRQRAGCAADIFYDDEKQAGGGRVERGLARSGVVMMMRVVAVTVWPPGT